MRKFKKEIITALSLILVLILVIAGSWAYFTDKQTLTNTFTVGGGVIITLTEPLWTEQHPNGMAHAVTPGEGAIDKDPTVQAFGDNCWVRIKLVLKDLGDNPITDDKAQAIFDMIPDYSSDFYLDTNYSREEDGVVYYNYDGVLKADGTQIKLFGHIIIPGWWTEADGGFQIIITAEAIQEAGFEDNPTKAFAILHGEATGEDEGTFAGTMGEVSEETKKKESGGATDEKSDEVTNEEPDGTADETPDEATDGDSGETAGGDSDGATGGDSDGATGGDSDGTTGGDSDGATGEKSDRTTGGRSDRTTGGKSDGTTGGKSNGTTGGKSDGATGGKSDGTTSDGATGGTSDGATGGKSGVTTVLRKLRGLNRGKE